MLWTASFWKGAAERSIKTFFQCFVAMTLLSTGADLIPAVGIEGIPWLGVLSGSAVAALLSLATSIGNAEFTAGEPPRRAVIETEPAVVVHNHPAT